MAKVLQKQKQNVVESSLNKVESKSFVKKMLAVGISNILYLRNIFPESAFANKKYEDIPVKILKEKEHEGAGRIVQWVKGVYDALDKEYLRAVVFAIISDLNNPQSVVESYTFGFTYESGTVQTSMSFGDSVAKTTIPSKLETQESTKKFLRNLVLLTTNMENLPSNVFMTVRLLYYDKVTPPDYQPPGFTEAIDKDTLSFMIDNVRIKVGHVQTPHTSMKVRVRAAKDQFHPKAAEQSGMEVDDLETTFVEENLSEYKQPNVIISVEQEKGEDHGVQCPCLDQDNDGLMILCSKCYHWQHAICFCLYDEKFMPNTHICHLCSDKDKNICTDPRLTGLPQEQQQIMCSWRRTLQFCMDKDQISISMISTNLSSSKTFAKKLLKMLVDKGLVLQGRSSCKMKKINEDALRAAYEQSIVHVCHNLQLQRLDVTDNSNLDNGNFSPPSKQLKKLSSGSDDAYETAVEKINDQCFKSSNFPANSQSSEMAFRIDQDKAIRPRKKRKLSKFHGVHGGSN